jgi:adenylate cyclase
MASQYAEDGWHRSRRAAPRDCDTFYRHHQFHALVERLDPSVLGPLLNEYLTGMTDIVFVGDALHVLFGAPGEQPDHAARAVACALALDEYAQAFRQGCHQKGIPLGVTRIGVHAGPAIVGNFGGGRFFDYTAYGDTINVAARLEAANKPLGTRICVSATLAGKVKDFQGRPSISVPSASASTA